MAYLWGGMLLIGIVYGVLVGNVDEVTKAFVSCSGEAVSLCISMAGITAMWTGMMKIAENSGLVTELAAKMRPLIRFLFPKLDTESKAAHYICLNFLSNVLGLSWASTSSGLCAMKELKELAKGDDRILFTGFVQGEILNELYSNAYIYTLPSDLEGMPLSLLEAMSYGNCCLVSDIPECTEVVEDKALIFKKSNIEDLQEKLQDACDHPEMVMKIKNQAADFICEKYNWDEVVKETIKLYRRK